VLGGVNILLAILIDVTELGMVAEVRPVQLKTPYPIVVTELGIVTEVRFLQP